MAGESTVNSESVRQWLRYLFKDEIAALKELAVSLPDEPVVVNVGAGGGTSALAFLESRPDLQLWTVDIQKESSPFGCLAGELQVVDAAGLNGPRYHQIHGDSKAVGKEWEGPPIDMVFVDGGHTYDACCGDILNWTPHVVDGGIIAVHDYDKAIVYAELKRRGFAELAPHPAPWKGVDLAIQKFLVNSYEIVLIVQTLIAFRKNDAIEPGAMALKIAYVNDYKLKWRYRDDAPVVLPEKT